MANLTFKDMNIDDIISWCEENGQTEWLKAEAARTVTCKVYPRTKDGINKNGKPCKKADKTAKPSRVERPITFVQIKKDFCKKFMPELIPQKKAKKTTMYDRISKL